MAREQSSAPEPTVSAIILAGGQSRRLGRDKALLTVQGQPLVARTVQRLTSLSDDLIVVTNDSARYSSIGLPVRLVPDEVQGMGSLMGLFSGLKVAHHPYALAVACDMPFLSPALLGYMFNLVEGYDVIIPRLDGMLEPLHAIYSKSCLPFMADMLQAGRRKIIAFFDEVRVRFVEEAEIDRYDPDHRSFFNINTPDDWERLQALLAGSVSIAVATAADKLPER